MDKIILLGMGGHAHSVIDSIESTKKYQIIGIINNELPIGEKYKEYSVIGTDKILPQLYDAGIRNAFICIGFIEDGSLRKELYDRLKKIGYKIPNIIDPTAILASNVLLGEGNYIGKRVVINANAEIRNMCIINTGSIIEHDCIVNSFSHISVGAVLCGNVRVGADSFVGANSTIIQGKTIGKNVTIGAGTVVTLNQKDDWVVIGNPGKQLRKK